MAVKPKRAKAPVVAVASVPDLRAAYVIACDAAKALYDPLKRSDAWRAACDMATLAWNRLQAK